MAESGKTPQELAKERVGVVYHMLLDGKSRRDVFPFAAEWDVCDRTVRNYLNEAEAQIGREAGLHRQTYLGRVLMRLECLYVAAMDKGDRAEARKVLKDIREMMGLDEAVEIRHLIPTAWHQTFDEMGIRIPGNGADGGKDESPQVRH